MQIILKEDVPHLGKAGDVVKVKDGYGRNYLLPKKKALLANPSNLKELEHHKRLIAKRQSVLLTQAEDLKRQIEELLIEIQKEAGQEQRLFGSVTSHDITEALARFGYQIDKRLVQLEEPIKTLGNFSVPVKLHSEVIASVRLVVVAK